MTDLEIAKYVRHGRREGFARACAAALCGLVLAAPIVAFTHDPVAAAVGMAAGVIAAMGLGAVLTNRDPG